MKSVRTLVVLAVAALLVYPAIAHHPAADIVDAEIYEMIDSMVSDTHADMVFDDMGAPGVTETDITTNRMNDLNELMDDGLLDYVALLDGDVTLTIDFTDDRNITLSINQVETPAPADKALTPAEKISLDSLKADFR